MRKNKNVSTENTSPLFNELPITNIQKAENYIHCEVINNASAIYGEILPDMVSNHLETELNHIINNGFSSAYMIANLIVCRM